MAMPLNPTIHPNHRLVKRPSASRDAGDFHGTLSERFFATAARWPNQTAVVGRSGGLSYARLEHAARAVAHALGGPDGNAARQPVLLLADHDQTAIAGLVGILAAGAFYVPLDPADPVVRLSLVATRINPIAVVTDAANRDAAAGLAGTNPLIIIEDAAGLAPLATGPQTAIDPSATACVYFTSGSTGTPKGVVHNNATFMHWAQTDAERLGFGPDDRLALLFHLNFSASRIALFGSLLNGGSLHLYDVRTAGMDGFLRWAVEQQITVLSTFPSLFREAARSSGAAAPSPYLRLIHLAGENASQDDLALLHALAQPECVLDFQLGSTEAGPIAERMYTGRGEYAASTNDVGFPVQDKQVRLLDETGRPVGQGEIGEIQIRSAYLSTGYWNDPAGTDARFTMVDGVRAFNSGDRGRWMPDGSLQFLGRKDLQFKIRGFRVEPGEIESALTAMDEVAEAVVTLFKDEWGKSHLVTYYVPSSEVKPDVMAFRSRLLTELPDYMIPTVYSAVEALPRTVSGKPDRNALRPPDFKWLQLRDGYKAATWPIEASLVAIWEEALNVKPIGIRDDFVELGGESLDAMRIMSAIKSRLGADVAIDDFFEAATIEEQARLFEGQPRHAKRPSLTPIQTQGTLPILYCMHPMGGLTRLYYRLASFLGPDQPVYGLKAQGLSGKTAPHQTVEDMAAHYLTEIRDFQPQGPYFLCGFSFGGVVAYEAGRQLVEAGVPDPVVILIDTKMRFTRRKLQEFEQRQTERRQARRHKARAALRRAVTDVRAGQLWRVLKAGVRITLEQIRKFFRLRLQRYYRRNPAWAPGLKPQRRVKYSIIKANSRYQPVPYTDASVHYIKASKTDQEVIDFWLHAKPDLHVHEVHGGHKDMLRGDSVEQVAEQIRQILDAAIQRRTGNDRTD